MQGASSNTLEIQCIGADSINEVRWSTEIKVLLADSTIMCISIPALENGGAEAVL